MDGDNGQQPPWAPIQLSSTPGKANSSDGDQNEEEDHVMSEIHLGCPPKFSGSFVSHFTFSFPPDVEYIGSKYENQVIDDSKQQQEVSLDDDGDLALPRRSKHSKDKFVVAIQHNITSSIPNVGLQIWRAELVLSDFVMHKISTSSEFEGIVAVELGAGTGLVGMLLARVAKTVFLTDHGVEILENCARNVHLNSALIPSKASVYVRELDWKSSWPPKKDCSSCQSYAWNLSELEELGRASLLVAADVIYSDDLTDALFSTLERLMLHGSKKVLYLALEKRYNFSFDDLDVVANGYSRFRSYVRYESDDAEHDDGQNGSLYAFVGTHIDLTAIPQYVNNYDRGQDVELWQIDVTDLRTMKFFTKMFDTWFKSKFDSKCMSNIKLTLERIEMIKRRRMAMQKFLRSDIAELLKLGFDSNAYGRVGRLYLDQKRTLCYDFIEQFCTLISNHLTTMKEQSECPEECREAVQSLIYAAARIADLPELRVLRSLFTERYGNNLESFVNKEFVDLLKPDHPTNDMKIQLMKDIALEYGVDWDSKSLERKLYKVPSSDNDWSQNAYGDQESHTTHHENDLRISIQETGNEDINNGTRVEKSDEPNGELEKLTENVRKRISDYWSRTTSLLSTSRETTTSSEESSSSESSSKRRPFFPFRLMPPPYVKNGHNTTRTKQKHNHKENQEVSDNMNIEIWAYDEAAAPRGKSRRRRKGAKSHSTECLPNPVEPSRGHTRSASYQPDSNLARPIGHVHPKLPDYDDILAQFAALKEKS